MLLATGEQVRNTESSGGRGFKLMIELTSIFYITDLIFQKSKSLL